MCPLKLMDSPSPLETPNAKAPPLPHVICISSDEEGESASPSELPVTPVIITSREDLHLTQEEDLADYAMQNYQPEYNPCLLCVGQGGLASERCCSEEANHLVCSNCIEELRQRSAPCPWCRADAPEWESRPLAVSPDPGLVMELSAEEEQRWIQEEIPTPQSDDDRSDDEDFLPPVPTFRIDASLQNDFQPCGWYWFTRTADPHDLRLTDLDTKCPKHRVYYMGCPDSKIIARID